MFSVQTLEGPDHFTSVVNNHSPMVFYSTFSLDANAVALVSCPVQKREMEHKNVQVWSKDLLSPGLSERPEQSNFVYRGGFTTSRLLKGQDKDKLDESFAFHPNLPVIIFSEWQATSLWAFNKSSR